MGMSLDRMGQMRYMWNKKYENNDPNASALAKRIVGQTVAIPMDEHDLVALDEYGIEPWTPVKFGHNNSDPTRNSIVTAQMAVIACSFAWPKQVPSFDPRKQAEMFYEGRIRAMKDF